MNGMYTMVGKAVDIQLSGNLQLVGMMIDVGVDVVVIFDGENYMYIPTGHIQKIRLAQSSKESEPELTDQPLNSENEISYRKILLESKGMFVQIFVTGNQSIHGYVTHVMSNYFVFYSPVHQTLFIPMFHLKWLIPYPENKTPYTLKKEELPAPPSSLKLARTFEEQIKKMEGGIVVIDLGSDPEKIGLLKSVQNHMAEVVTAEQTSVFWNLHHIKMIHQPNR